MGEKYKCTECGRQKEALQECEWCLKQARKKKTKKKKPYTIECKYSRPSRWAKLFGWQNKWRTYSRYETEKRRDTAFNNLNKKDRGRYGWISPLEFRKGIL